MKKSIYAAALAIMMVIGFSASAQAQSTNDNALIGRAVAAYRAQCNLQLSGQVSGTVEDIGICFVEGFIKRVNLYPVVQCHREPCPLILVIRLGSVDFDCEGNIISVNCE